MSHLFPTQNFVICVNGNDAHLREVRHLCLLSQRHLYEKLKYHIPSLPSSLRRKGEAVLRVDVIATENSLKEFTFHVQEEWELNLCTMKCNIESIKTKPMPKY